MNYRDNNSASDSFASLKKEVARKFEEAKQKDKIIAYIISIFTSIPLFYFIARNLWGLFRIQIGIIYSNDGLNVSSPVNGYVYGILGINLFRFIPSVLIISLAISPYWYKKVRVWRNKSLWGN